MLQYLIGINNSDEAELLYEQTCQYFAKQYKVTLTHPMPYYRQLRQNVIDHINKEMSKTGHLLFEKEQFLNYLCDATIESFQEDIFNNNTENSYEGLSTIQQDAYFWQGYSCFTIKRKWIADPFIVVMKDPFRQIILLCTQVLVIQIYTFDSSRNF